MATLKTKKADRAWFAERCGEMLVKDFTENISVVINEALERHRLEPSKDNRQVVTQAYKTANPNCAQYAKNTYDDFYEQGAERNDTSNEGRGRVLGYLAIDRERSLKAVRDAIKCAFTNEEISSLDPRLIEIFKFGENNAPAPPRDGHEGGPSGRDADDEEDALGSAFRDAEGQLEAVGIYESDGEEETS